jgi:hypothetical protein
VVHCLHDFQLEPNRRPKILVQTAGHVSGAVRYAWILLGFGFVVKTSVSNPYSFFPDPDPEVEAGDQYGSGSRALLTKN